MIEQLKKCRSKLFQYSLNGIHLFNFQVKVSEIHRCHHLLAAVEIKNTQQNGKLKSESCELVSFPAQPSNRTIKQRYDIGLTLSISKQSLRGGDIKILE